MQPLPVEFDVYMRLIDFLQAEKWQIVCASPPAGTDNRFRKCLLPRRQIGGPEKAPRDEVDLTAHDGKVVLLAECKPTLSDSLTVLNTLGESDYAKLNRIATSSSPTELAQLLQQATGLPMPQDPVIALALVVGTVNCDLPLAMSVLELGPGPPRLWTVGPLLDRFRSPPAPPP